MKKRYHFTIFTIIISLLALSFGQTWAQQSVAAIHKEGVALYEAGNYVEALAKFQQVLRAQPNYINARVYSNKCQVALKSGTGPKNTVETPLSQVIIPSVDFQDVPLGDALTYLSQRTTELTQGKFTPNIIFNGSSEQKSATLVTMQLRQVPVTTLLKYVASQTRCKIAYDEHAVVVTPLDNIPQTVSTSAPTAQPDSQIPATTTPPAANPFK
jgi:tetratricopeptide (TPR) repeat protein